MFLSLAVAACVSQSPAELDYAALRQTEVWLDTATPGVMACKQIDNQAEAKFAMAHAREEIARIRESQGMDAINNNGLRKEHIDSDIIKIRNSLSNCGDMDRAVVATLAKCNGMARIGMDELQVRHSSWCEPNTINRTTTADHEYEQWVYRAPGIQIGGFNPRVGYLYFTDGVLTAIQEEQADGRPRL